MKLRTILENDMNKYENILLDLDGTIIDSKEGVLNAVRYALSYFGIEESNDSKLIKFIGPPLFASFRKYFNMDEGAAASAVKLYREYYGVKGIEEFSLYKGMDRLIRLLSENGYRLFLLTAKPEKYAVEIIKRLELESFFELMRGSRMDISNVQKHVLMDELLNEKKLSKSKTVMVGDSISDVKAASVNRIDCIAVTYSYGDPEILKSEGNVILAGTIRELTEILVPGSIDKLVL